MKDQESDASLLEEEQQEREKRQEASTISRHAHAALVRLEILPRVVAEQQVEIRNRQSYTEGRPELYKDTVSAWPRRQERNRHTATAGRKRRRRFTYKGHILKRRTKKRDRETYTRMGVRPFTSKDAKPSQWCRSSLVVNTRPSQSD